MAGKRDWSRILEVTFWTIAIVWLLYPLFLGDSEVPFRMRFYFRASKVCYGVASLAGELGIEAERAYWEVVRELN